MLGLVDLVAGDYADPGVFTRLADTIAERAGAEAFAVHYLAVPPSLFGTVADGIAAAGLAPRSRLVVEKPFGHDLASARALDARLRRHYPEDRVFRVDHFLGKEPVEDLLVLRFANTLLETLWNRQWIDHFEITMAEDFDVADRGSFYDAVGTVRDVVQNHLLQVLAYLLMDPPLSIAAEDQRDAKHRLLRAVRTIDPAEVVRGRYDGYLATPGVAPGSTTETYVALTLHVDDWRWAGRARAHPRGQGPADHAARRGRRPAAAAPALFPGGDAAAPPDVVRLRLQPDAGVTFTLVVKQPGSGDVPVPYPSPSTSGRCSARCTPPTSGSSPTHSGATRRTSPGWTTSSRPGASSVRSSTHAPHRRGTRRARGGPRPPRRCPARRGGSGYRPPTGDG